jgi:hypothetical protein
MPFDPKIERLEYARKSLGLSKGEWATSMGIVSQYYSQILAENGKGNLRLEHLEQLLKSKAINPAWILSGQGSMLLDVKETEWIEQSVLPDEIGAANADDKKVAKLVGDIIASIGVPVLYSDLSYHLLVRACRQYIGRNPGAAPDHQDTLAVTSAFAAMLESFQSLLDATFELSDQEKLTVAFQGNHYTFRRAK